MSIDDIETVIMVKEQAGRQRELPFPFPSLAKIQQKVPLQIKNLNVVESRIGHIDVTLRVDRHAPGPGKGPRHIAYITDGAERLTLGAKDFDTKIHRIADEYPSGSVHRYIGRAIKAFFRVDCTAEGFEMGAVTGKHFDGTLENIDRVEITLGVTGQAARPAKAARRLPDTQKISPIIDGKDFLQGRIGDIESAGFNVDGNIHWRRQWFSADGCNVIHSLPNKVKRMHRA